MIVLYNPTDESMTVQHAGISRTIDPGTKLEVGDATGQHVLNSHGARGLCQLFYGCDEEKIRKEGIALNIEFKKKQVIEYNQRNENRKQMGLPFQPPTTHIKQYAIDLGLELLEPYAVRDAERQAIADSTKENEDLKRQIGTLTEQMAALMKVVSERPEPQVIYKQAPHRKQKRGVKKDE